MTVLGMYRIQQTIVQESGARLPAKTMRQQKDRAGALIPSKLFRSTRTVFCANGAVTSIAYGT